jgi:hypothetical protein
MYFVIEGNRIGVINGKGLEMSANHPHPMPFLLEGTIAFPWVQLVKVSYPLIIAFVSLTYIVVTDMKERE